MNEATEQKTKPGYVEFNEQWSTEGKVLAALVKRLGGKFELPSEEVELVKSVMLWKDGENIIIEAD